DISGKFCQACGQPAHIHRTLGHMVEEFLHGIIHFDTRAWRTLPLLVFRPGTLTREYIHGKRARYISPLAMFLLVIFSMFAVFAFTGGANLGVDPEVEVVELTEGGAAAPVHTADGAGGATQAHPADTHKDIYTQIRE